VGGNDRIVKLLLSAGADVNVRGEDCGNALGGIVWMPRQVRRADRLLGPTLSKCMLFNRISIPRVWGGLKYMLSPPIFKLLPLR
jgi:hypothetical protein